MIKSEEVTALFTRLQGLLDNPQAFFGFIHGSVFACGDITSERFKQYLVDDFGRGNEHLCDLIREASTALARVAPGERVNQVQQLRGILVHAPVQRMVGPDANFISPLSSGVVPVPVPGPVSPNLNANRGADTNLQDIDGSALMLNSIGTYTVGTDTAETTSGGIVPVAGNDDEERAADEQAASPADEQEPAAAAAEEQEEEEMLPAKKRHRTD
jgi:hypothetical protein